MIERLLQRAYIQLDSRRYLTFVVCGAIPFNILTTFVGVLTLAAWFRPEIGVTVELLAIAVSLSTICIGVTYLLAQSRLDPGAVRWMSGERNAQTALVVWTTANTWLYNAVKTGVTVFAGPFAAYALYATLRLHQPLYAWPGILGGVYIVVAWAAVIIYFWFESASQPPLIDAARMLSAGTAPPTASLSVRRKMMTSGTVFAIANIVLIGGIASTADVAPAIEISIFASIAVVASLSVALVNNALITRSVLDPIQRLIAASKAVGEGDLTVAVPPLTGDELGMLTHSFNVMVRGLAEREALRLALGSYVEPRVAERLLAEGELLDGAYVEVTVLFLDIRGFTTQAETQDAADTVAYLNQLFGKIVPIVAEHGGHVNKFTGDGLLAVFGTPEHHADHADRALTAARAIALTMADDETTSFGIGINSGKVVAGTIGGAGHLEFAVIGDAVNVASRVEALTKETNDVILLTAETKSRLTGSRQPVDPRGRFTLRGRAEPTDVFALLLP